MVGIRRGIGQGPRGQGGIAGAAGLREHVHRAGVLEGPQLAAQVQALGDVRGATVVHRVAWHAPRAAQQDTQGRHGPEHAAVVAAVAIAHQRQRSGCESSNWAPRWA